MIDEFYHQLVAIQKENVEFNELEVLFDQTITKYKALRDIREEVKDLKKFWDLVSMVNYSYENYNSVPWAEIDVDSMTQENEQFLGVIKMNTKKLRHLTGFKKLQTKVENMKTMLSCLSALKDVKLEERHWKELEIIVGHEILYKDPTFTMGIIVAMNLHEKSDQVNELAETAKKEEKYERQLHEIKKEWEERNFEFEVFTQNKEQIKIFKPFDDIEEILGKHNQRILSLLSQGASVRHFRTELTEIKTMLSTIENTLTVWDKVQKNWKRLVNIFLLSEDIKQ